MRKFFKKMHLWLGIPAGLIITIACFTGSMLSFEPEILELVYPERYFVEEIKAEKLPLEKLIPIVNEQLTNNSVASIKIQPDPNRTYTATLTEGFRVSAFINPYTGQVIDIYNFQGSFFHKTMALHRWLMDGSRTWGKYTVGIATLLFVFIVISGIVWWAPTKKKQLKKHVTVKTRNGIKRFLHDAHTILGLYASILLVVCCLTGLMWSFDWYRSAVYSLFGAEVSNTKKQRGGGSNKEGEAKDKKPDYHYWDVALANIENSVKDYQYITLSNGSATVLAKAALHSRASDKYSFNKKDGTITEIKYYTDQPASQTLMTWAYALHVGSFGGIIMRILTCIACFIGATLPLTGYYLFWRKRHKKRKQTN